jgi:hypothetical protein
MPHKKMMLKVLSLLLMLCILAIHVDCADRCPRVSTYWDVVRSAEDTCFRPDGQSLCLFGWTALELVALQRDSDKDQDVLAKLDIGCVVQAVRKGAGPQLNVSKQEACGLVLRTLWLDIGHLNSADAGMSNWDLTHAFAGPLYGAFDEIAALLSLLFGTRDNNMNNMKSVDCDSDGCVAEDVVSTANVSTSASIWESESQERLLDALAATKEPLEQDSGMYVFPARLTLDYVAQLVACTEGKGRFLDQRKTFVGEAVEVDLTDETKRAVGLIPLFLPCIAPLAQDPAILEMVQRSLLGSPPILRSALLTKSLGGSAKETAVDGNPSAGGAFQHAHEDLLTGFRFVKVFVYLSDVLELGDGAHSMLAGTHLSYNHGYGWGADSFDLNETAPVHQRQLRQVLGRRGTMILGRTRSVHWGAALLPGHKRLMLELYFVASNFGHRPIIHPDMIMLNAAAAPILWSRAPSSQANNAKDTLAQARLWQYVKRNVDAVERSHATCLYGKFACITVFSMANGMHPAWRFDRAGAMWNERFAKAFVVKEPLWIDGALRTDVVQQDGFAFWFPFFLDASFSPTAVADIHLVLRLSDSALNVTFSCSGVVDDTRQLNLLGQTRAILLPSTSIHPTTTTLVLANVTDLHTLKHLRLCPSDVPAELVVEHLEIAFH